MTVFIVLVALVLILFIRRIYYRRKAKRMEEVRKRCEASMNAWKDALMEKHRRENTWRSRGGSDDEWV